MSLVVRRPVAIALIVLLQIGTTSNLLEHVHADGAPPDHQAGRPHAHLPGPGGASHRTSIDHPDEGRAMAAQVFVAVAADPFAVPAVPPQTFTLVVPLESALGRVPPVAHAHDPPARTLLPSRAPPVFLS